MGIIATKFAEAFRDYATEGVPASGEHEPVKSEIRALGPMIETALANLGLSSMISVAYATRAELEADLAHPANAVAFVYADPTPANNDLYVKTGASGSGSWTLTPALNSVFETLGESQLQPFVDAAAAETESAEGAAAVAVAAAAAAMSVSSLGEIIEFQGMPARKLAISTVAGSWYQNAAGAWVQTLAANQSKPLYSAGRQTGFIFAAARGPVNSAPIHNTVPTSGQPGFATQSSGSGTLTFAYAGQHATPDRYGGTGAGILVTVNSGNSRLVSFDGQARAFTAGQHALVGLSFAIAAGSVPAGAAMLIVFPKQIAGTMPGGQITATMGADGKWAFTVPSSVRRGGGVLLGNFNGLDRYFVWWEQRCVADCTIAPQIRTPNVNIPGFAMLIEECWVEQTSGLHLPRPTPVMAHDVTLPRETFAIGSADERFDVIFMRQRVARRGAPGDAINPPNFRWGGPLLAGEDHIIIRPSAYDDDAPVYLPTDNNKRALSVFGNNETIDCLIHGHIDPGQIDERDGLTGAQRSGTRINIRSAFGKNEPASVEYTDTSQTFVTHIDAVEYVHLLTSDVSTSDNNAMSQAEIWVTPMSRLRASVAVNLGEWCAFGSHSGHHGRWNRFMPADTGSETGKHPTDVLKYNQKTSRCYWYGTPLLQVGNGGAITIGEVLSSQIGNGPRFIAGPTDNVTIEKRFEHASIYSRRTFNDGINCGSGRYSFPAFPLYVFEPSTYLDLDLYHCPPGREIEVDTGAGWVALSASTLVESDLPCDRYFERWGTYDSVADTLTYVPIPSQRFRIAFWGLKNIGGVANKPGFQFHASRVSFAEGTETALPDNTVYVSYGAGTVESPHIRVVRGSGRWTGASTFVTTGDGTGGRPVGYHSGMHSDAGQFNFSQLTDCRFGPAVLVNPPGQGFMIQGQETSPARSTIVECVVSEVIAFVGASNGILIQGDATAGTDVRVEKTSIVVADPEFRFIDGGIGEPGKLHILGVDNATIDAATVTTTRRVNAPTGTPVQGDGTQTAAWSGRAPVAITGRPRQIVRANVLLSGNTAATALLDGGGNVIEPTMEQVTRDASALTANGLPDGFDDLLGRFRYSEAGNRYLGWDGNGLLARAFRLRESWRPTIEYMDAKQKDWIFGGAKATIVNTHAVGAEIVLFDVDGNVAQFPGYYIDQLTGDGFGRDGYIEMRRGRAFLRRALTGLDRILIVTLTRADPSGETVNLLFDVRTS